MDKQCYSSTGQCSEVGDNYQEFCGQDISERCSLKESKSDYMCNLCNKLFANVGYLNYHIKFHVANKPHSCQICSKSFTRKGELTRHLLTHSGEKPNVCNICNKSFTRKGHLKTHLLTHSGEKPHICDICNKSFNHKVSLKNHLLKHNGEKPHVCNICNMTFRKKFNLNRHLLIHSRKKDMQNSPRDREEELPSTSEKSKNVNSDSRLAETSENSHENNHPGILQAKEEIEYIVKEENDISDEEYSYLNVGEKLIKSDVDLHKMSCDVKEENIHYEMNDVVKEEHDIDYEDMV